jgi:hypothetical protein
LGNKLQKEKRRQDFSFLLVVFPDLPSKHVRGLKKEKKDSVETYLDNDEKLVL